MMLHYQQDFPTIGKNGSQVGEITVFGSNEPFNHRPSGFFNDSRGFCVFRWRLVLKCGPLRPRRGA